MVFAKMMKKILNTKLLLIYIVALIFSMYQETPASFSVKILAANLKNKTNYFRVILSSPKARQAF